ncbi:zinc-binding dehydrogenase [Vibrio metschnikovii]
MPKQVLGFDECLDHKADDFAQQLAQACPQGIDVYYENVGGKVFDAVLPLLNTSARVPVCGLISQYAATAYLLADRLPLLMGTLYSLSAFVCKALSSLMITAIVKRICPRNESMA